MSRFTFEVKLTVQGPVISRSVATGRVGIDAFALRDPSGLPALPGSLVRGLLRHAWKDFGWHSDIERWLGGEPRPARNPNKERSDYHMDRSVLRFADHWSAERHGADNRFRHRIRVEPDTGAVSGGGLMIMESPFGPGETVVFSGAIELRWPINGMPAKRFGTLSGKDDPKLEKLRTQLQKGLRWTAAVGGLKGTGFGRVLNATVDPARAIATKPVSAPPSVRGVGQTISDLAMGLRIKPDSPLCFPAPGPKGTLGNRYRSGDIIPGAALKAALAAIWPEGDDLRTRYFDSLRITQGLPVRDGGDLRPLALPFSLAYVDRGNSHDALDLARNPDAIFDYSSVPRLQPDWKPRHRRSAQTLCGWGDPPEHGLQVHNAIHAETGTVDYDDENKAGLLYSLETVSPDQHQWLANLIVPSVEPRHRKTLIATLEGLLAQGFAPLGKTDASASVLAIRGRWPFHATGTAVLRDGIAIMTLQSPALLLPRGLDLPNANGGARLHAAYARTFSELSGDTLDLIRFFARQQLGGGRYWWNAFRPRNERYEPVLLTLPGSVFVLRPRDGSERDVKALLNGWLQFGLPPIGDAPGGGDWRANPWLRENGYAEVAINAEMHWREPPRADFKGEQENIAR